MSGPRPVADPSDRAGALERLMGEYGTKVLHLAFLYVKDRQTAEDIAQEAFIKAYQHWDTFRGESSAYTWLYRITVNLCRDRLRSASWRRVIVAGQPSDAMAGPERAAPLDEAPDQTLIARDQRRTLLASVARLPKPYSEVVLLYYYQELSTSEIAQVTDSNENTVKTRLFRARALLKDALEKGGVER